MATNASSLPAVVKEHLPNMDDGRNRASGAVVKDMVPPTESVATESADTENLMPLDNPSLALEKVQHSLRVAESSMDWREAGSLIRDIQCLSLHHASLLNSASARPKRLYAFLLKQASSPRSALARSAFAALENLFMFCPNTLVLSEGGDQEEVPLDALVQLLTLKSTNEKKFIADGARDALDALVLAMPSFAFTNSLLMLLTGIAASSKSTKLTAVAMRATSACVAALSLSQRRTLSGLDLILTRTLDVDSGKSVESRPFAQETVRLLNDAAGSELADEGLRRKVETVLLKVGNSNSMPTSTGPAAKPWLAAKSSAPAAT